jgi:hypothetical protein
MIYLSNLQLSIRLLHQHIKKYEINWIHSRHIWDQMERVGGTEMVQCARYCCGMHNCSFSFGKCPGTWCLYNSRLAFLCFRICGTERQNIACYKSEIINYWTFSLVSRTNYGLCVETANTNIISTGWLKSCNYNVTFSYLFPLLKFDRYFIPPRAKRALSFVSIKIW